MPTTTSSPHAGIAKRTREPQDDARKPRSRLGIFPKKSKLDNLFVSFAICHHNITPQYHTLFLDKWFPIKEIVKSTHRSINCACLARSHFTSRSLLSRLDRIISHLSSVLFIALSPFGGLTARILSSSQLCFLFFP